MLPFAARRSDRRSGRTVHDGVAGRTANSDGSDRGGSGHRGRRLIGWAPGGLLVVDAAGFRSVSITQMDGDHDTYASLSLRRRSALRSSKSFAFLTMDSPPRGSRSADQYCDARAFQEQLRRGSRASLDPGATVPLDDQSRRVESLVNDQVDTRRVDDTIRTVRPPFVRMPKSDLGAHSGAN